MAKKSFVQGAAVLAVAGLMVKVLGAIFRIPLGNWIGDVGMANYNPAYYVSVSYTHLTLPTNREV